MWEGRSVLKLFKDLPPPLLQVHHNFTRSSLHSLGVSWLQYVQRRAGKLFKQPPPFFGCTAASRHATCLHSKQKICFLEYRLVQRLLQPATTSLSLLLDLKGTQAYWTICFHHSDEGPFTSLRKGGRGWPPIVFVGDGASPASQLADIRGEPQKSRDLLPPHAPVQKSYLRLNSKASL